jgi:hypothetical protein
VYYVSAAILVYAGEILLLAPSVCSLQLLVTFFIVNFMIWEWKSMLRKRFECVLDRDINGIVELLL